MAKSLTPLLDSWENYQDQIHKLASLNYNYDEKIYHGSSDKKGWFVDRYQALLAKEPPGLPLPNGAFDAVKNAIKLYQFPDPRLISAVFDPQAELPGRNMLMFAKFAGFTFTFGVRVTSLVDEVRKNADGESLQVWGYSYRTLTGHFEIGEILFEVSKNLKNGEIIFGVNAYSKPDRIPNLFYRAGFRIFGRSLQKYFARSSIQRLQQLAQSALAELSGKQATAKKSTD